MDAILRPAQRKWPVPPLRAQAALDLQVVLGNCARSESKTRSLLPPKNNGLCHLRRQRSFVAPRTKTDRNKNSFINSNCNFFNPRSLLEKIVTRSLEYGGGGSIGPPPPSTFDKIHPIDLKFGTYNKLHLYFQLSETTWCLIGFHGNNSQVNDVTVGRHLGFSNFHFCTSD